MPDPLGGRACSPPCASGLNAAATTIEATTLRTAACTLFALSVVWRQRKDGARAPLPCLSQPHAEPARLDRKRFHWPQVFETTPEVALSRN